MYANHVLEARLQGKSASCEPGDDRAHHVFQHRHPKLSDITGMISYTATGIFPTCKSDVLLLVIQPVSYVISTGHFVVLYQIHLYWHVLPPQHNTAIIVALFWRLKKFQRLSLNDFRCCENTVTLGYADISAMAGYWGMPFFGAAVHAI